MVSTSNPDSGTCTIIDSDFTGNLLNYYFLIHCTSIDTEHTHTHTYMYTQHSSTEYQSAHKTEFVKIKINMNTIIEHNHHTHNIHQIALCNYTQLILT